MIEAGWHPQEITRVAVMVTLMLHVGIIFAVMAIGGMTIEYFIKKFNKGTVNDLQKDE